jgi:heptosyltransferase-3
MDILIISLAGIGDTFFTTPLIRELRMNYPEANVDALLMWPGSKDLLEGNPHLNTLYQKNLIKSGSFKGLTYLSQLRKKRYDISFNTHPQSRTAYRAVARFIGADIRVSHDYDNVSALDSLLVNRTVRQDYQKHSVENNLALLELVGKKPTQQRHKYELFLSAREQAWAMDYVKANALTNRKLLGIHVGSGGTKNLALRRWPLEYYSELINRLAKSRPQLKILLFGGPEEERDHQQLMQRTKEVLFPKTADLRQAAALIQQCYAFISVDTALMHVAAAVNVPKQIVIETPTWNKPIEPYRDSFSLVRNPAVAGRNLDLYRYDGGGIKGTTEQILRCMRSVTVDSVESEVQKAID